MLEKINETTEFLKAKGIINPDAGIILGTGLGGLTAKIENRLRSIIRIFRISLFQQLKDMPEN